jgi:hypothetical protein
MTDTQLYLVIGVPIVTNLLGFTLVGIMLLWLNSRMTRVEDKIDALTGKVVDVDNRVIRIEDKMGISPR